jgi:hypothetical protein
MKAGEVDSELLCPMFDKFCCCLPEKMLKILRCNVDYTKVSTMIIIGVLLIYELTHKDQILKSNNWLRGHLNRQMSLSLLFKIFGTQQLQS